MVHKRKQPDKQMPLHVDGQLPGLMDAKTITQQTAGQLDYLQSGISDSQFLEATADAEFIR